MENQTTTPNGSVEQRALHLDAYAGDDGLARLAALLEAMLIVCSDGATLADLAEAAATTVEQVDDALAWHATQPERGILLVRHGDRAQVASHPRFAAQVRRLLKIDREARLSPAALETLAIVAYQQPVTRSEIEAVRGVDCSGVLATLHTRGLVEAIGRLQTVGNPIQYGTTAEFLRHFGLQSLSDLPPLGSVDGRDIKSALEAAVASADEEMASPPGAEEPPQPAAAG